MNKDIHERCDYALRTKEKYAYHVKRFYDYSNKNIYGVNKDCSFNTFNYIHLVEGTPHDAIHDLVEGILLYEIALQFKHIIFKRYIAFTKLN